MNNTCLRAACRDAALLLCWFARDLGSGSRPVGQQCVRFGLRRVGWKLRSEQIKQLPEFVRCVVSWKTSTKMSIPAEIHRVLSTVLLVILLGGFGNALVYFTDNCGATVDIGKSGGVLKSQFRGNYTNDLDCTVTLTSSLDRKILLVFSAVNIEGDTRGGACKQADYLEVFDGDNQLTSLEVICGTFGSDVTSTGNSITLQFKTNAIVINTGFTVTYTSFKESSELEPCMEDEFKCDNGRCIDKALTTDLYNNCGDLSDIDGTAILNNAFGLLKWGIGVLIAIIVGVIVCIVLCCVCVGCLCYHCCCKNRQQPQYTGVTQTTGPPAYNQQPPMAMQPAGQQPYGQPAQI